MTALKFLDGDVVASVSALDNMLCIWHYQTVTGEGSSVVAEGSAFDDGRSADLPSPDSV